MTARLKILLAVCCLVLPAGTTNAQKQQAQTTVNKLALIIAIGDYDRNATGWPKISSERDIPLIKGALLKVGFDEANIAVIQDQNATRDGLLTALKALKDKAKTGDMVVIHVSSHGQQVTDSNNEEVDGYDEAIIAYGAPAGDRYYESHMRRTRGVDNPPPYDGSLHLRDEDFGDAITAIRQKIGNDGHVLVSLDACHSGSGTRGSAQTRGGEHPYDLQGVPPASGKTGKEEGGFGIEARGDKGLGKFILISGASAAEVNYETQDDNGQGVGSLSYCFSKALPAMESGSTYRKFFARISSEMADKAPQQTPQLEGDVDQEIFGKAFTPQPAYFKAIGIVDARHVRISAGKMMNAPDGTTVIVKSSLDGKQLAKGKVQGAGNFESTIELDTDLKETKPVNLQVFPSSYVVEGKKVMVNLDSVSSPELKSALTTALSSMGLVQISKDKSDLNVSSRGNYTVNVNTTAYGTRLMNRPIVSANVAEVVKKCSDLIQNYSQGQTFRSLDMKDAAFNVVIRVLPFKPDGKSEADTLSIRDFMDKGNVVCFPEGTRVVIWAKNFGARKAYFNVIDFEPNGKINPVFPIVDRKSGLLAVESKEFVLEPGQARTFSAYTFTLSPPYGMEMFKVFATGMEFDLSSTINYRGAEVGTRGRAPTQLEKLMGKSFEATRGAEFEAVTPEEMGTNSFEYVFKISKKR